MKTDTIAAIATAFSEAGIGIIRISGENALEIADKVFLGKRDFEEFLKLKRNNFEKFYKFNKLDKLNKPGKSGFRKRNFIQDAKSYTMHYGYILDGEYVLDEVLLSVMRGPKSYTAEDVVEINCHGGVLILQKILELVIRNGARIAEPGEFTKRAFLNGRIDLSEAEAVMDLIQSKNEFAMKASVGQLNGGISYIIRGLRSKIIHEVAFIESALDDPENYSTDGYEEKLFGVLESIDKEIKDLINRADNGKILKEGIQTVILGKPNAGKSSFLNELLREEKAIVTDIPGTTRDALEENIRIGEMSLHVIDTAGIRNTEDKVEKIGVEKARKYAAEADLIVYIVDSSVNLDESDEEILRILKDKRFIVLLNKSDLEIYVNEDEILKKLQDCFDDFSNYDQRNYIGYFSNNDKERRIDDFSNNDKKNHIGYFSGNEKRNCTDEEKKYYIIKTSVLNHQGIEEFEEAVKKMFLKGKFSFNDEVIITSMRHKEALMEADESILMVEKSIEAGMSEDFYSIDLMNAYAALGKIIGEEVGDDLVNEIFEKFCMGK